MTISFRDTSDDRDPGLLARGSARFRAAPFLSLRRYDPDQVQRVPAARLGAGGVSAPYRGSPWNDVSFRQPRRRRQAVTTRHREGTHVQASVTTELPLPSLSAPCVASGAAPPPTSRIFRSLGARPLGIQQLGKKNAGNNPNLAGCDGGNTSPALGWSGAPATHEELRHRAVRYPRQSAARLRALARLRHSGGQDQAHGGRGRAKPPPSSRAARAGPDRRLYFGPCPPPG